MKKQNRILKNEEFSKIIKIGKKYFTKALNIYFVKNESKSFRIGITISKKVSKLAIMRNKVKRRISAALIENYPTAKNYDIVIIAKPNSAEMSYQDLETQIKEFIQHI